jgi:hypothetical protein
MFRWTEASISCSNLSAAATCERADSASSSTRLKLMGGGGEPEEPGRYSPDTPGLKVLEGQGLKPHHPGQHDQILQQTPGTITQLRANIDHLGTNDPLRRAASTRHLLYHC